MDLFPEKRPMSDSDAEDEDLLPKKRRKPGIIYLSYIPPGMSGTAIRDYFSKFGEIDRSYLHRTDNSQNRKKRIKSDTRLFKEGWIEFKSKRKAKEVQQLLNNQPVGGNKKSLAFEMLWCIKYLPRFKWAYLKQRLEYENEMSRQRMVAEVSQVQRETDHYLIASHINQKKKRKEKVTKQMESSGNDISSEDIAENSGFMFKQRLTEEEILAKKNKKQDKEKRDKLARQKREMKKKKRMEKREKRQEEADDILGSVFVGGAE